MAFPWEVIIRSVQSGHRVATVEDLKLGLDLARSEKVRARFVLLRRGTVISSSSPGRGPEPAEAPGNRATLA